MNPKFKRAIFVVLRIYVIVLLAITVLQRKMLYIPSHNSSVEIMRDLKLSEWVLDKQVIGYSRVVEAPKRVWLFLHGNGGQAIDRAYALSTFDRNDSVFFLEYPGFGSRDGSPSMSSLNSAAKSGYEYLRTTYPNLDINVFGESLGSGPSCYLASLPIPPNRLVLVVPFDRLVDLASAKLPFFPIRFMLFDKWDNIDSLSRYTGKVDIYGASKDVVIPVHHAKNLADSVSGSVFHKIRGGHNEWLDRNEVDLRIPNGI
jgi:pimeloyl-ACP methyl ester carboxylesterase